MRRTSDSSEEKSSFDEGENDENILFQGLTAQLHDIKNEENDSQGDSDFEVVRVDDSYRMFI